jgi:hypothetical protein
MKVPEKSIEKVEKFGHLETTVTNRNDINEKIKSTLNLRNA